MIKNRSIYKDDPEPAGRAAIPPANKKSTYNDSFVRALFSAPPSQILSNQFMEDLKNLSDVYRLITK
jgi:hypothetical protein